MISPHWRSEQLLRCRSRIRSGKRFTNRGSRSKWWLPAIIALCLWGWVFSQSIGPGFQRRSRTERGHRRARAGLRLGVEVEWCGYLRCILWWLDHWFLICGNGVGERHFVDCRGHVNYRTPIARAPSTRRLLGGVLIHVWTKQPKWWYMFLLCEWESNL